MRVLTVKGTVVTAGSIVCGLRILRAEGAPAVGTVDLRLRHIVHGNGNAQHGAQGDQIRAHMAHIGHPLLGDGKYGKNAPNRQIGFSWQALVSYRLRFAFTQEAGILEYLNGREFTAHSVWFLPEFEKMAD